ncbi:tat pathway signal sequence [Colletotrichum truncatum]|uniref:Tat pathway signal sequence n=1 Tax=Colletotrichum truncatum TaxID=5467 RepID=A0ACC3YLX9_COLTU|nr:tat pathway signal sequence [Colletotrichum truncatum]KAF6791510.1 tat pathway signal sequence [Colletotrichum truncatum]
MAPSDVAMIQLSTVAGGNEQCLNDIGERVQEKEKARGIGLESLRRIQEILQKDLVMKSHVDVNDWNDNLGFLQEAQKSREILVGVTGETGLGKSSLINALLGYNIVPTSQSEACTAAVCIFGWNDERKKFKASITFKSRETVETELDALKEEMADLAESKKARGDERDPDFDLRWAQVKQHISNIENWSGLSQEQIRNYSPARIIKESKGAYEEVYRSGKGNKSQKTWKNVTAMSQDEFLAMLRPYVDSTKVKGHSTQADKKKYWPLVEQVEIFLKSEVLRNGVKIVDLPGVMDALESRAQVARNYYYRLDKRIIVTPATRAADNKAAADLILSDHDINDLDMDDMLKRDALCIAVTKIDDIDITSAATEFPTEEILDIVSNLQRLEGNEEQLTDDEDDDYDQHASQNWSYRQVTSENGNTKRQKIDGPAGHSHTATDLRFRLRELCIQQRNFELKKDIEEKLFETFKRNKAAKETAESLPAVFPVSSKAYQDLRKHTTSENSMGFRDRQSTGIPDLKKWLNYVSLPQREEWVDSDIHHIQVLLDAADGWIQNDAQSLPKLTGAESSIVNKTILSSTKQVGTSVNTKVRTRLQSNLKSLKPLRDYTLVKAKLSKNSKNGHEIQKSFTNLLREVSGWKSKNPQGSTFNEEKHSPTHWATYRACIRRNGGIFQRPARNGRSKSQIHWMEGIQNAFWRGHGSRWRDQFTRRVPEFRSRIQAAGLNAFRNWITQICEDQTLPEPFLELLKSNAYKLDHLFGKYISEVRGRIAAFQIASRLKKEILYQLFTNEMKPGFRAALNHKGSGSMKKQISEVNKFTDEIGLDMLEKGRNELEGVLVEEIRRLSKDVGSLWSHPKTGCGALIRDEMLRVAGRLSKKEAKHTALQTMSDETRSQIGNVITDWRRQWQSVYVRLPHIELEDCEDEEDNEDDIIKAEDEDDDEENGHGFDDKLQAIKVEPADDRVTGSLVKGFEI